MTAVKLVLRQINSYGLVEIDSALPLGGQAPLRRSPAKAGSLSTPQAWGKGFPPNPLCALSNKNKFDSALARPTYTIHARDFTLSLGQQTKIMGIINVTPDSFSLDGLMVQTSQSHPPAKLARSRPNEVLADKVIRPAEAGRDLAQTKFWRTRSNVKILTPKNFTAKAIAQAEQMIADGADILDIGGESTRPGSRRITIKEEIQRILPVIQSLRKHFTVPISVDTYKSSVAQAALDAGASIINTIKGVAPEKKLLQLVKHYDAAIVLMHSQGTPATMQRTTRYPGGLIPEILRSLKISLEKCFDFGIKSDKIIVDPGIGFGKTVEQNLEILRRLREFEQLKCPILVGTSRKSFIGRILKNDVDQRLFGSLATFSASIMNGAQIIRVHDVKAAKETATMTDVIINQTVK